MSRIGARFGAAVIGIVLIGCGRTGYDPTDGDGSAVDNAIVVTEPGALVLCGHRLETFPDGRLAVVWLEFPSGVNALELRAAVLSSEGATELGPISIATGLQTAPPYVEAFPKADGSMTVFYGRTAESGHIDGVRVVNVSPQGSASAPLFVSALSAYGIHNLIAGDNEFGLFYRGFVNSTYQIFFRRLGPTGVPMTAQGAALDPAGTISQSSANAAWNGTSYSAIWDQSSQLFMAAVTPDGTLVSTAAAIDHGGVGIAPFRPAIMVDPAGGHLAIWRGSDHTESWVRKFAADGSPIWTEPKLLINNRLESVSRDGIMRPDGVAAFVWESDVDTALPQLVLTTMQPSDGTVLSTRVLTDGNTSYACPQLARGVDHHVISFLRDGDGGRNLYLSIVAD